MAVDAVQISTPIRTCRTTRGRLARGVPPFLVGALAFHLRLPGTVAGALAVLPSLVLAGDSAARVVAAVMARHEVLDIAVREPDIEDVVAELYLGRV
ncbi:MAG: hypothetical protein ACJ786_29085 [Catenulispora sp.]